LFSEENGYIADAPVKSKPKSKVRYGSDGEEIEGGGSGSGEEGGGGDGSDDDDFW